jgi:hypothetical protein
VKFVLEVMAGTVVLAVVVQILVGVDIIEEYFGLFEHLLEWLLVVHGLRGSHWCGSVKGIQDDKAVAGVMFFHCWYVVGYAPLVFAG